MWKPLNRREAVRTGFFFWGREVAGRVAGGGHERSRQPRVATHVMSWEVTNVCVGQSGRHGGCIRKGTALPCPEGCWESRL